MANKRECETAMAFAQTGKDNGYKYKDVELLMLLALHCDDWLEKLKRMTEQMKEQVPVRQMIKEIVRDIPWESVTRLFDYDD